MPVAILKAVLTVRLLAKFRVKPERLRFKVPITEGKVTPVQVVVPDPPMAKVVEPLVARLPPVRFSMPFRFNVLEAISKLPALMVKVPETVNEEAPIPTAALVPEMLNAPFKVVVPVGMVTDGALEIVKVEVELSAITPAPESPF